MSDQPEARPETQGDDLPEQMRVRREKRQRLLGAGGSPTRSPSSAPTRSARSARTYDGQELEPDTRTGERGRGHRPGDLPAQHRQALLRPAARGGRHRAPGDALPRRGRRGVAGRVQGARRPRRPARRPRRGGHQPPRRAVRAGDRLADRRQDAAAAAQRAQAAVRRGPRPAALRRHDGPPRGARDGPHQGRRAEEPARDPRRARLRRGRDADPAADQRRRRGPAVPHPPERARPGDAAAHRPRARPQAGDDRRRRQGLRDRPDVPQRGPRLHPCRGVLDARGLRGVRRPVHDDGADQGPGRNAARAVGRTVVRRATAARSTSRASGGRRRSSSWSPRRVGETSRGHRRGNAARATPSKHDVELQPGWGAAEIVVELLRAARRGHPDPADVRHGLPGGREAARQAAPQRRRD